MRGLFISGAKAWLPLLEEMERRGETTSRETDREIALALGWRVSHDPWWNWHPGPRFDPPGDEWCIRRDARNDVPCNEGLPHFTTKILNAALASPPPDAEVRR